MTTQTKWLALSNNPKTIGIGDKGAGNGLLLIAAEKAIAFRLYSDSSILMTLCYSARSLHITSNMCYAHDLNLMIILSINISKLHVND